MRSSPPMSAFTNPRVSESVCARKTMRHRHLRDSIAHALGFGFRFGQADVSQLGIGEEDVRNDAAARRSAAAIEIVEHDAEVILTNVREVRASGRLAGRPNVWGRRLQPVVDADVAARIDFDTCSVEIESVRVGRSASRHENVGSFQRSLICPRTDQHRNHFTRASSDLQHLGIQQDFDPLILHQFQKTGGNIGVFFLKQTRTVLNDRDAAPEASHRLGKLQADVTSPEDDEVFRQALQVQGFDVRHRPGVGEPRNVGDTAPECRH